MSGARLLAVLPQTVLLAAAVSLAFLSGGYIFSRAAPVALGLAVVALVWLWVVRRRERLPAPYVLALVALAAFTVWTGLSVLWSVGPDLSWRVFDVMALCLGIAWFAAVAPVGRLQLRVAGYGYVIVALAVAAYAFSGKVLPDVVLHAHTYARLSEPVGYWNVLAMTTVFGAVIALEAAARPSLLLPLRGAAAAGLLLLMFTLFFTFSRGGFVALVLAFVVFFVLSNRRLSAAFTLAVVLVPLVAVLWHVRHLSTLFNSTTDDALRTAQGHALGRWFLVALAAVVAVQLAGALLQRRLRLGPPLRLAVGAAVVAGLVVAVLLVGDWYFPRHGGLRPWVRQHYEALINDSGGQSEGAGRLLVFSTNGRLDLYREALRGARGRQALGTGAGTFRFTHFEQRVGVGVVKHAHSEWFNVYSELGVVGLALYVAAIAGLVVSVFGRLFRDRSDADRALLAALQAGVVAFVFHISVDWDWGMVSVTLAFLLFAATAVAYLRTLAAEETAAGAWALAEGGEGAGGHRRTARRLPVAVRALASGLVVIGVASWTLPYLSERSYSTALDEARQDHITSAVAAADRAGRLDPLAVDPLIALAQLQQRQGRGREARATLERALRLQPRNYEVYYQLGLLELNTFGSRAEAAAWFRKALVLNPRDTVTRDQLSVAEGG